MRTLLFLSLIALYAMDIGVGNRYYGAGDYERAAAEYQRALERGDRSPALHYNLGTALLRLGRHEEARVHLEEATRAEHPDVRQRAFYNLGNLDLEPAFHAEPTPERLEQLRRAVTAYRAALLLDPGDLDAKWNLELAQRLLEQQAGGAGGGDGPDDQTPADPDPSPDPAAGPGPDPDFTPERAEEILQQVSEIERELQREKLRRAEAPPPNVRDW